MALSPIEWTAGPRVCIRPVSENDLADLFEINGDPTVTAFLPYHTWTTSADGVAWLKRMNTLAETGTAQQLVIERNADSKIIGTVLLFRFDGASSRVEIGYVLGRAHWGQGLMKEALGTLFGSLFEARNIRRIEAEVDPANTASSKLLTSLGFVLEGRLRSRWVTKGAAHDTDVYGLLCEEWLRLTND